MVETRKRHRVLGMALVAPLVAAGFVAASPDQALAGESAYAFKPVAFLGDPAPGGGAFTFDFEPSAVNNEGKIAFTADVTTGGEGTFLARGDHITQLARAGNPAPRGGIFAPGELGRMALNGDGAVTFTFSLEPPSPENAGVYRFSLGTHTLKAVMAPGDPAPGLGAFEGSLFHTSINNQGDVVFSGFLTTPGPMPGFDGTGLFRADKNGDIHNVVRPGDPAPGGGVFDEAINGWINDRGQIALDGHVSGEPCVEVIPGFLCGESVYLRSAGGAIKSIAHQGDASPCAGAPYRLAFGPVLNNRGDLVFIGDLTPPPGFLSRTGVFLSSGKQTESVACPGDRMPGGGRMVSAANVDGDYAINNQGRGSFAAVLNTDSNHDGIADSGIYSFSTRRDDGKPQIGVVARTGTQIPGVGTIATVGLASPGPASPPGPAGGVLNDRGQVLVFAKLTDGRGVLLIASPAS